jgi:hypothetical protein
MVQQLPVQDYGALSLVMKFRSLRYISRHRKQDYGGCRGSSFVLLEDEEIRRFSFRVRFAKRIANRFVVFSYWYAYVSYDGCKYNMFKIKPNFF